jgi:hypothetical protein
VVQTVTSSVVYSSGSNVFGNNIANTQVLTGSVTVTGSLAVVTNGTEFQVTSTGVNIGNALTDSHVISGSIRINPNGLFVSGSGNVGIGTSTLLNKLDINQSGSSSNPVSGVGLKVYADAGNDASIAISQTARGTAVIGMAATGSAPADMIIGNDVLGNIIFKQSMTISNLSSGTERFRINATGAAIFSSTVDGTIFNSTSNAFRFSGNNAISLVSLNAQNVVKINAAGYWGVQLVGANDQGILINNTGIVGIGTTDPSTGFAGTIANVRLALRNGTPGASGGRSVLLIGGDNNHYSSITGEHSGGGETYLAFGTSASVQNPTERMRITSAGVIIMGTPSANSSGATLQVEGTGNFGPLSLRFANAASGRLWKVGPDNTNNFVIYNENNTGAYIGYSSTSWTGNSDIRLKNVINPITDATSKLSTLNPIVFSWKSDSTNRENLGLVAQDVEKVFPQVIDVNSEDMLGIRYSELIPVLVKAIQEVKAEIDELKNK